MDDSLMDLEDFEMYPATYEVLLAVFDNKEQEFDHQPIGEFENPEEAIEHAKAKTIEYRKLFETGTYNWDGDDIKFACITVETKVKYDNYEDYVGQLYNEPIYYKET